MRRAGHDWEMEERRRLAISLHDWVREDRERLAISLNDWEREERERLAGTATNPISDKPHNRDKPYKRQTLYATNFISDQRHKRPTS